MTGRNYPRAPLLGVSVIVRNGAEVLLVQRANAPMAGLWSLPGGLVRTGEPLAEAARREVREEAGIDIADMARVGLEEIIDNDPDGRTRSHYVLAVFSARALSVAIVAGDDAAEVAWLRPREAANRPLTSGTARWLEQEAG